MIIQYDVGQLTRQAQGTAPNAPGGNFGEALDSRLFPDLYTLAKGGFLYTVSATGVNPTAFTGGAAGTPIFGIYNPITSGKDLVIIQARLALRTGGTAAASTSFNFWGVSQGGTAPTGTQSQARNLYTMGASGSQAYVMNSTANTGALASNLIAPSFGLTTVATTPTQQITNAVDNVNGAIIVPPGGYLAYGISVALTSGSVDAALIWAEVPV